MSQCFHGGSFWQDIGVRFDRLDRRDQIINADVLDAWFPPAPGVIEAFKSNLGWVARTSPPTKAEGLIEVISERTGVPKTSLIVGPGSSSFIFEAFRTWLTPSSRVLLVEPTYGEYAHVAKLVGCHIDYFTLSPKDRFHFDLDAWSDQLASGNYDLAVLVNPNNPTGGVLSRKAILSAIKKAPNKTRIWIDEAYLDYTPELSATQDAAQSNNLYIVKSLSKSLALSGLRVAYLAGPESELQLLSRWTPPWNVSLPAQIAAVKGLEDPNYYASRYQETAMLRRCFATDLLALGLAVQEGEGNWLLCRLPQGGAGSSDIVDQCAQRGIYIRDAGPTAPSLGDKYIRIAVKPPSEGEKIRNALADVLHAQGIGPRVMNQSSDRSLA